MTDNILCPWCGSEMVCFSMNITESYSSWYECKKCGANGPALHGWATEQEARQRSKTAALRRYEQPIRPLTLDEVKPGVLKIDEWVEFSNGYVRHIIPDMIDGEYLWDKNDCYYDLRTYGTDWRLWPRRPTEDERKAVEWDD